MSRRRRRSYLLFKYTENLSIVFILWNVCARPQFRVVIVQYSYENNDSYNVNIIILPIL